MKKIIITGPESSGKTTLAQAISKQFACPWVPEYARIHLSGRDGNYEFEDLREIAQKQKELESSFATLKPHILIHDCSFLVLKIWSEYKFSKVDPFILEQLANQENALFLLCKPDFPWVPDPLRENAKEREILFNIYKENLDNMSFEYNIISGDESQRLSDSINLINNF